jgi:hypothetical protein
MRMPRFIKPNGAVPNAFADTQLRPLGEPAAIIPFPGAFEQETTTGPVSRVPARVQLRTRRLSDNQRPEEDRYEAAFIASDASPVELLRSLTAMLEEVNDLKRSASVAEPVILDIHLIAG